jgi:acylpyruvate hydrolase
MTYIILQASTNTKEKIPVSKILCLGLNYASHVSEMKWDKPEEPVVFMKPASAIIHNGEQIFLPSFSREIHHEVETVILIGETCKNIQTADAAEYICGVGIGLDMTLRDVQSEAKKKGKPWTVAKGFDTSAPVSDFISRKLLSDINNLDFRLTVNGETRQQGNTRDMLFNFSEIISYLSGIFTLNRGDLIFTGTPEGVGPVNPGDKLTATLGELVTLNVSVSDGKK